MAKNITIFEEEQKENSLLHKGDRTIDELLAPVFIDRSNEDEIIINDLHARTSSIVGMRDTLTVGWLDDILSSPEDIDFTHYICPTEERIALQELTKQITQYEAQLGIEYERGQNKRTTELPAKIRKLYEQREKIESNIENLYMSEIFYTLYANSKNELDKETEKISSRLNGKRIITTPLLLRQDDAYKSCLPYGKQFVSRYSRNFNTGSLVASFPFYNSEVSHEYGTFIGLNMNTRGPIYLDMFNKQLLYNANMNVLGISGIGKSFFVTIFLGREVLNNVKCAIVDVEGDFKEVTRALSGSYVMISQQSKFRINPCDIEEEDVLDEFDAPTGQKIVDIKSKCAELLNLIVIMCQGVLEPDNFASVTEAILKSYSDLGITTDPESLFIQSDYFDEQTGKMIFGKVKKSMPQLSSIYNNLEEIAKEKKKESLFKVLDAFKLFIRGGIYDLFDCQTSREIDFKSSPITNFDVSKLDDDILRPIGMYIAMSHIWTKFVCKDITQKKRVVCDEAWILLKSSMAGSRYSASFLENCSRRIRKRNGGLLVASQKLREFENCPEGQAILSNAYVKCIFRQDEVDIDVVKRAFRLSDGESDFLRKANQGEMLLKVNNESALAEVFPFPFEKALYSKNERMAQPN